MDKNNIDREAEQEATALRRQGRDYKHGARRIRQQDNYNTDTFNQLFVKRA